jgi:hypothetical protein
MKYVYRQRCRVGILCVCVGGLCVCVLCNVEEGGGKQGPILYMYVDVWMDGWMDEMCGLLLVVCCC